MIEKFFLMVDDETVIILLGVGIKSMEDSHLQK